MHFSELLHKYGSNIRFGSELPKKISDMAMDDRICLPPIMASKISLFVDTASLNKLSKLISQPIILWGKKILLEGRKDVD